jgi:hypothetical protein
VFHVRVFVARPSVSAVIVVSARSRNGAVRAMQGALEALRVRRRARVDSNHAHVVEAMRSAGYLVVDTSRVGSGFPDALAVKHGHTWWIEIKDGAKSASRRRLTADEQKFHQQLAAAGVTVRVIETIEQAVNL